MNYSNLIVTKIIILLSLTFVISPVGAQSNIDESKNLVVMIRGDLQDSPTIGAGLVFGVLDNRLYIVTANHVVRRGETEANNLEVEFWSVPNEPFSAKLLRPLNTTLDVAVLTVRLDEIGVSANQFPFQQLGTSADLNKTEFITTIGQGNGRPWVTLRDPINVISTESGLIEFQSPSISPGDSGGGVFTDSGKLVGMVIRDSPPSMVAIAIESLNETLQNERYPFNTVDNVSSTDKDQTIQSQTAVSNSATSSREMNVPLGIGSAKASSTGFYNTKGDNSIDGSLDTGWVTSLGITSGAKLSLTLTEASTIKKLRIYFHGKSKYSQIKIFTLRFPDGTTQTFTLVGKPGWEEVNLAPIQTKTFELMVDEVFTEEEGSLQLSLYELEILGN
jgi:Trypsin-like peptidase domain